LIFALLIDDSKAGVDADHDTFKWISVDTRPSELFGPSNKDTNDYFDQAWLHFAKFLTKNFELIHSGISPLEIARIIQSKKEAKLKAAPTALRRLLDTSDDHSGAAAALNASVPVVATTASITRLLAVTSL